MRSVPYGGACGPFVHVATRPVPSMIACRMAVNGVDGSASDGSIFPDIIASRSEPSRATIVTPVGCPSTAIGVGSLQSAGFLMGPRNGSSHPAALIARAICCAKAIESKSSAKYTISTLLCGASWRASTNADQLRLRGSKRLMRNSASAVRAFAFAISLFAVSACAETPNLYCSKAALASSASALCNLMTAYVEMPTITAAIAPSPKDSTIKLFQESRARPSIRLTFLGKFVFSICAISCASLLRAFTAPKWRRGGRAGDQFQRQARTSVAAKSSPLNSKGAFMVLARA
jgi:hypothetical protein